MVEKMEDAGLIEWVPDQWGTVAKLTEKGLSVANMLD
jgi:Mn-dependent DtxR family transcriptional regulator